MADHAINPARDQPVPGLNCHQSAEPVAQHEDRPKAQGAARSEQRHTQPADPVAGDDPDLPPAAPGPQNTAMTQRSLVSSRTPGLKLPPATSAAAPNAISTTVSPISAGCEKKAPMPPRATIASAR